MKTRKEQVKSSQLAIGRKINKVFQSYGIQLQGWRGNLHLKNDLHMDDVFIKGLIFELEYATDKYLEKDLSDFELRPIRLVEEFYY
jgi:acyl carrier protein